MSWVKIFPHQEIGWKHIGEEFTRYTLLRTPWFNIYLHELSAPRPHPECHDHPWSFFTLILRRGYLEQVGQEYVRRKPGTILYRPAEFSHNVTTPYGKSWSIILTSSKKRQWGFNNCGVTA